MAGASPPQQQAQQQQHQQQQYGAPHHQHHLGNGGGMGGGGMGGMGGGMGAIGGMGGSAPHMLHMGSSGGPPIQRNGGGGGHGSNGVAVGNSASVTIALPEDKVGVVIGKQVGACVAAWIHGLPSCGLFALQDPCCACCAYSACPHYNWNFYTWLPSAVLPAHNLPALALPVFCLPSFGVQGAVINQIKELLGVSIRISKKGEFLPGSHDRACSITGTPEVRRRRRRGGGRGDRPLQGWLSRWPRHALLCPKLCPVCAPRGLLCPCLHAASPPGFLPCAARTQAVEIAQRLIQQKIDAPQMLA
jgi:hypothetical protein